MLITVCNGNEGKYLLVKSRGLHHKILLRDIFYIESQNNKVVVHSESDTLTCCGKMKDLEDLLGESFFRCHRCYIVNMEYVVKYNASTIWLKNSTIIALAQKKYGIFVKAFVNFAKSG